MKIQESYAAVTQQALRGWVTAEQLGHRLRHRRDERGDINGYVFVTLMTAGIVMVVWVLARDRLTAVFNTAISSLTPRQ